MERIKMSPVRKFLGNFLKFLEISIQESDPTKDLEELKEIVNQLIEDTVALAEVKKKKKKIFPHSKKKKIFPH